MEKVLYCLRKIILKSTHKSKTSQPCLKRAFSIYQKIPEIPVGMQNNGTRLFGSFHWKFSGINGIPKKVVPFSRWKLPSGNLCSIYRFLVFITSSMVFALF